METVENGSIGWYAETLEMTRREKDSRATSWNMGGGSYPVIITDDWLASLSPVKSLN